MNTTLKNTPNMRIHLNVGEGRYQVYIGELHKMAWTADFAHYTDAYNWACECAITHECKLIDYTSGRPVEEVITL